MIGISSYQKLKERIKYLEQACKELEEIAKDFAKYTSPSKLRFFKQGIKGDSFITSYNVGNFEVILRNIFLEAHKNDKDINRR